MMNLRDELRVLREGWQIFCQWDDDTRHETIVRNLTYTLGIAVLAVALIGVLNWLSPVPTEVLFVMLAGASGMLLLVFGLGVMFEPTVLAMEARTLRERHGDTIRRSL